MELNNISKKLKDLRIEKGYSLEEIAKEIPISKQGYHLWEQGLRNWKLDVLTKLSDILDFEITIRKGILSISNNNTQTIFKGVDVMNNIPNSVKKFDKYEIIKMYTGASNVNFEEGNILEECLVYTDAKEACHTFNIEDVYELVPVYALYDTEGGYAYTNTYSLDSREAYSMYYMHYAPVLDDENTVYVDSDKKIKVSKKYVSLDTQNQNIDGSYNVVAMFSKKETNTLAVFVTTDLEGFRIPQIDYITQCFPTILY